MFDEVCEGEAVDWLGGELSDVFVGDLLCAQTVYLPEA